MEERPAKGPWSGGASVRMLAVVGMGGGILLGLWLWNAAILDRKLRRATAIQSQLTSEVSGVTGLRVWGAGERQTREGFCPCARVPRPEHVLYETRNAAEIADFARRIHPRPHLSLDPEVATCGTITIDFLRGDEIAVSFHLMGWTLRSWGASLGSVPITKESYERIEEWLKEREIREKLQQEVLRVGVGFNDK